MVAETIMKKLFNRNKELEKWYESNPRPLNYLAETTETQPMNTVEVYSPVGDGG